MTIETIAIIHIAIILFLFLCLILNNYFGFRNEKVSDFRNKVLDYEFELLKKILSNYGELRDFEFYNKLPSYEKMLYSFKKLKLETYFTLEEIKTLKGE